MWRALYIRRIKRDTPNRCRSCWNLTRTALMGLLYKRPAAAAAHHAGQRIPSDTAGGLLLYYIYWAPYIYRQQHGDDWLYIYRQYIHGDIGPPILYIANIKGRTISITRRPLLKCHYHHFGLDPAACPSYIYGRIYGNSAYICITRYIYRLRDQAKIDGEMWWERVRSRIHHPFTI